MRLFAYQEGHDKALGVFRDTQTFFPVITLVPELPASLDAVLAIPDGLEKIARALRGRPPGRPVSGLQLLPFLDHPNALWALALNFRTHIEETGLPTSREYPHLFLRTAASYVGPNTPILSPPEEIARAFDYEGELGVIIGKPGRHIPRERALEHVAGYTCINEGSVREYQLHNRQFGLGKNFEASGSYGPWLVTPDEFGDPSKHAVVTRLNGVTRQRSSLDDMLFDVAGVISYLSAGYMLRPGDMIAMGTPGALPPAEGDEAGRDLSRQHGPFKTPGLVHMRPGDVVEIEISGLGVLRNPIVADAHADYRTR